MHAYHEDFKETIFAPIYRLQLMESKIFLSILILSKNYSIRYHYY